MSALREAAEEYLTVRRALGYKLDRQGWALLKFVSYAEQMQASRVTNEMALAWATQPSSAMPQYWRQRLSVVRGFARHLQTIDPRTEVPPTNLLPPLKLRRAVPYLYSETEIRALIDATQTITPPLRAATYRTLIGLLAVTGLRIGEAIALDRDDLHPTTNLLVVRNGKQDKPREVPLHPSTVEALQSYARRREDLRPRPTAPSFFVSTRGTRLDRGTVGKEFDRLRRRTGLQGRPGSRPPRMHDLRYSYVLRTLLDWHRSGADVDARLPLLSTYLGHVNPTSTYWYCEAAPELLALAAQRLERQQGGRS